MVRGYKYTAVLKVNEKDIASTFRNVKNTFNLTFDDYRCGFIGQKSLFSFKDPKHYKMFVLHCNLNGFKVYDSMDDCNEALVAQ